MLLETGAFWNVPHKSEDYHEYMDAEVMKGMRARDVMNWAIKRGFPGNTV